VAEVTIYFREKGTAKPHFPQIEGKKERGWAIRTSSYRIFINISILFKNTCESPPTFRKRKYRHNGLIRKAIYGGKRKNLNKKLQKFVDTNIPLWLESDLKKFCEEGHSKDCWIIESYQITDLKIVRIR